MYRRGHGQPIRDAMTKAGLSIEKLAAKTRDIDPAGWGIKPSTIGHMVCTGRSGRDRFTDRSCDLVARALDEPITDLFSNTPPTG